MHLTTYLRLLHSAETILADAFRLVSDGNAGDADVHYACRRFAADCAAHAEALEPVLARYDEEEVEPERLSPPALPSVRSGPVGLLRDLQDLYQLANLVDITWTMVGQAAYGARDRDLIDIVERCDRAIKAQLAWLHMRMKAAAPQTLLVAS